MRIACAVRRVGYGVRVRFAIALALIAALVGCTSVPEGRTSVDAIRVTGNSAVPASDIKDKIATTATPRFAGLARGILYEYSVLDRFVLERDLERVERLYRARGYYEARAHAARIVQTSQGHATVEIVVDEGPPVRIARVVLDGLPPAIEAATRQAVGEALKLGAPFEEAAFEAATKSIANALGDAGFAFAKVTRDASIDLHLHEAAISFVIAADQPATIGPIRITGLGDVPEAPVLRAFVLREGDPYSRSAIKSAQQALLDLGVFSAVEISPQISDPPPTPRVVPLTVRVEPTRLRTIYGGGGFELDAFKTDVHGKVGWEHKNVFGGLERFTVELKPGVVVFPTRLPGFQTPERLLPEEKLRMELRRPGLFEARTTGFVGGELNVYPTILSPTYVSGEPVVGYLEGKGTAGVDRRFGKVYANLSHVVQVSDPFAYVGSLKTSLDALVVSYPRLFAALDLRDDAVEPHKGLYFDVDVQVAGFGGQPRDVRVQPDARAYVPIGGLTLGTRATFGFLVPQNYRATSGGTDSLNEGPRDQQIVYFRGFFSGGPNSNRGYPPRGVGPLGAVLFLDPRTAPLIAQCQQRTPGAECGVPLGGLTLWELSTELRIPITGPFSTVGFCDASDVSDTVGELRFLRTHLSCGLGARYATPIGPIRFDVGYRIPGMQLVGQADPVVPGTLFNAVPIALQFGIGEAF